MVQTRQAIESRVQAGTSTASSSVELDMLSWMGRTTLEVLGQAGLGHSFDPLTEDRASRYMEALNELPYVLYTLVSAFA